MKLGTIMIDYQVDGQYKWMRFVCAIDEHSDKEILDSVPEMLASCGVTGTVRIGCVCIGDGVVETDPENADPKNLEELKKKYRPLYIDKNY